MSQARSIADDLDDAPDDDIPLRSGGGLPPGLSDRADNAGGGGQSQRQQPRQEDNFEIIEADDDFRPLRGNNQQVEPDEQRDQPRDRRLDDDDAGDGTYLDQQRREHARETRSEKRRRQREGRERTLDENRRLRREMEDLRAQMAQFEPRFTQLDETRLAQQVSDVDRQLNEVTAEVRRARQRISEAMVASDPDAMTAALDERDAAVMRQQQLQARKNLLTTGSPTGNPDDRGYFPQPGRQPPQQQAAPQQPPRQQLPEPVARFVRDFRDTHDWYNPADPGDPDSVVVLALDRVVANQGYDPSSQTYWDKLDDLMRERLPHRFEDDDAPRRRDQQQPRQQRDDRAYQQPQQSQQRRGPAVGGSGDRTGAPRGAQGGGNQVYLTPQRKQAMQAAGVIDSNGQVVDKAKFARQLRAFQEFDRANGIGQRTGA